ncbi:MAG: hypothetical protein AB7P00_23365 [Sandaracinaceae bacterium]
MTSEGLVSRAPLALAVLVTALGMSAAAAGRARAQYDEEQQRERTLRVRFDGVGELGGLVGVDAGFVGGLGVGAGLQIGDYFAVYGQHRLLLGDILDGRRDGMWGIVYNTLMADLTLFDMLQLWAGPSLDVGLMSVCDPLQVRCDGWGEIYPGFDARVAVVFGRGYATHRHGFVIAGHVHPTFYPNGEAVVTATAAAGFTLY